jgi:pimeloyl-ACP methyl ester carboxylesterase
MAPVTEHTETLGEQPAFWRAAPGGDPPVLYLHGVPNTGGLWSELLVRTGGVAPDLPGFGRTGKRGDGDFTMTGLARWLDNFLDLAGLDRVRLVVHDWGAVGLLWAMRRPERVERLVVVDAVPFLPGYRWHALARAWRTPLAGEIAVGLNTRGLWRRAMPRAVADDGWPHYDQGTQRAILQLYRSAPADALAAAGLELGTLTCPALVVWGERDRYIPARFADAYAAALGGETTVLHVPGAGHWPLQERPDAADAVVAFLGS